MTALQTALPIILLVSTNALTYFSTSDCNDRRIGGVVLMRTTLEDAKSLFGPPTSEETFPTKDGIGGEKSIRWSKQGIEVFAMYKRGQTDGEILIHGVRSTKRGHPTCRGLDVGDSIEKATRLYGALRLVGKGTYTSELQGRLLLKVHISRKRIVTAIQLDQEMS
jgi:hypothetical protein